jgi:hypothetical protein
MFIKNMEYFVIESKLIFINKLLNNNTEICKITV